ncbi:MAG: hypothetical protein M1348_03695 [Candidatus Parvarchaeota archaeon]|nr:hypothetical protein [Candidatus Parvarchaeota archaeon]
MAVQLCNARFSATKFISEFCAESRCSKSAAWERLKSLKKSGLIDFGSFSERGKILELTKFGLVVVRLLYGK